MPRKVDFVKAFPLQCCYLEFTLGPKLVAALHRHFRQQNVVFLLAVAKTAVCEKKK